MSKDTKKNQTLTDEDMVTSRRLTRRTLLAGAGIALGSAAIAGSGRSALASDSGDKKGDKHEGDKHEGDKGDKAEGDKSDKAEKASGDKGDKSKIEYGRDKD